MPNNRLQAVATTAYTKCGECWHFVEPNEVSGPGIATWLHLDNGVKEHDHDATPSTDSRPISLWRAHYPELFYLYADGETGPNSILFSIAHDSQPGGQEDEASPDMTVPLKLFLWRDVLHSYTSGMAFAIARNVHEARGLLSGTDAYWGDDLAAEPEVHDVTSRFCAYNQGGG
jgi:hypothetical protein